MSWRESTAPTTGSRRRREALAGIVTPYESGRCRAEAGSWPLYRFRGSWPALADHELAKIGSGVAHYFAAMGIFFSFAFASFDLGSDTKSTPFSNLAEILSESTPSGSSKDRCTVP